MAIFIDPAEHIKVGSFYEIDHSKLPLRFPDQLSSIRLVTVNEKTRMRVSLRYPSVYSLRTYFNESSYDLGTVANYTSTAGTCKVADAGKLPAMDEKYTIGCEVAGEALYRRVKPDEMSEKRHSWRFWSTLPERGPCGDPPPRLLGELGGPGMVRWGKRRRVQFLARHVEEDESEDEVEKSGALKRTSPMLKKRKRPKMEIRNNVPAKKAAKHRAVKNCIDRWSTDRYKLAEVNILKVMKEKGAGVGNPILRPALRAAARKLIGDTGLLDHLLKHMAGKVAPGGEERFRRRHNADGAMEYWLERADLVDLRKEAGVQDPYWIPPPGWKLGDDPFQDPVVAGEINEIKEDAAELKKEMKETKEDIAQLKKDVEVLASKNHEDLIMAATPMSSVGSQTMEQDGMLVSMKEMYIDLANKKAKIEQQLTEISQSLCAMEEELVRLKSEKPTPFTGSQELTPSTGTETERFNRIRRAKEQSDSECWIQEEEHARSQAIQEDKASKIERLKSGFRICKPQGTFLWPDKALSSTQYAISPSSVIAHAQNNSKNQSVSSTTTITTVTTSSTTRTTLFNLNDPPENQNNNLILGSQSLGHGGSFPRTYHRRHQQSAASPIVVRCFPPAVQEMRHWKKVSEQEKGMRMSFHGAQERGCCSSSPLAAESSSLPRGSSSWLALATSKQSEDSKPKRG